MNYGQRFIIEPNITLEDFLDIRNASFAKLMEEYEQDDPLWDWEDL